MKSFIKILLLCIVISSVACITPQKTNAQISVNFQIFYDDLSPYGTWINTAEYGYAWMPHQKIKTSLLPVHGLMCARMLQYGALVLLHMNAYAFTIGHIPMCVCHCSKLEFKPFIWQPTVTQISQQV